MRAGTRTTRLLILAYKRKSWGRFQRRLSVPLTPTFCPHPRPKFCPHTTEILSHTTEILSHTTEILSTPKRENPVNKRACGQLKTE